MLIINSKCDIAKTLKYFKNQSMEVQVEVQAQEQPAQKADYYKEKIEKYKNIIKDKDKDFTYYINILFLINTNSTGKILRYQIIIILLLLLILLVYLYTNNYNISDSSNLIFNFIQLVYYNNIILFFIIIFIYYKCKQIFGLSYILTILINLINIMKPDTYTNLNFILLLVPIIIRIISLSLKHKDIKFFKTFDLFYDNILLFILLFSLLLPIIDLSFFITFSLFYLSFAISQKIIQPIIDHKTKNYFQDITLIEASKIIEQAIEIKEDNKEGNKEGKKDDKKKNKSNHSMSKIAELILEKVEKDNIKYISYAWIENFFKVKKIKNNLKNFQYICNEINLENTGFDIIDKKTNKKTAIECEFSFISKNNIECVNNSIIYLLVCIILFITIEFYPLAMILLIYITIFNNFYFSIPAIFFIFFLYTHYSYIYVIIVDNIITSQNAIIINTISVNPLIQNKYLFIAWIINNKVITLFLVIIVSLILQEIKILNIIKALVKVTFKAIYKPINYTLSLINYFVSFIYFYTNKYISYLISKKTDSSSTLKNTKKFIRNISIKKFNNPITLLILLVSFLLPFIIL